MVDVHNKLKKICEEKINFHIEEYQYEKLLVFMRDVLEKNKFLNLTRITEEEDFLLKHIIDSLQLLNTQYFKHTLTQNTEKHIMDVGTGAGFPGIPLAICLSHMENYYFVLSDSLNKRIEFIEEETKKIELKRVSLVHARAEDLGQKNEYREKFDIVLSRGVAQIPILAEYLLPFTKKDGFATFYKMDECSEEMDSGKKAIQILGGDKVYEKYKYSLYSNEPARAIINIKKLTNTPMQYPRKAGMPSKSPII